MSDIDITDVSDGAEEKLNLAVFDYLMTSVESRLDAQFLQNRLTGPEYAEVYLGSIQTVMAQAIQFVLQEQTAQRQAELLEQQYLTEVQNTAAGVQKVILLEKQILTETEQALKIIAETSLIGKQEDLVDKQILTEVQQALMIVKNIDKVTAEISLLTQKQLTEVQSTLKVTAEIGLLNQKTDTEEAQIHDTVGGAAVAGTIGKQKDLYTAQKDGFARDAEQKVLKILIDTWNVQRTTDDTLTPPTGLNDVSLNEVITKAKTGINV